MDDSKSSEQWEKLRKIVLLLIPVFYVALLSGSFSAQLFVMDDAQQMAFVRDLKSTWALLGHDVFNLFRPTKNIIWHIFSHLEGYGLEWCHAISIGLVLVSFYAVLGLCRRVFNSEWKALAAASVWLFSPTLTSLAVWLSSTNISVMVAFSCLTLITHDSAWNGNQFRTSRITLAGAYLFISLVSYECAVAILPILFLFDTLLRPGRNRTKQARKAYAWYFVVFVLYMVVRVMISARTKMGNGAWTEATRFQLMISSPYFTLQHFASWFWPFNRFTVLGSYKWGDASWWMLGITWTIAVIVLILAFVFWKRKPVLSFCMLFSIVGFAPTSNCLGFGNGPYGDYYMALASVGIAAGGVEASALLTRLPENYSRMAVAIVVGFCLTRIAAIPETYRWSTLWAQSERALQESVNNFPKFYPNKGALIRYLIDESRYDEALELGNQIENIVGPDSPKMGTIYLLRAMKALNVDHDGNAAFSMLDRFAVVDNSETAKHYLHYYRGCVFEDAFGDTISAQSEYQEALSGQWDFDLVPCANRLARLKAGQGERDEAILLWERALTINPNNPSVLWNLIRACRESGEQEKANVLDMKLRKLVGQAPSDPRY